MARTNDPPAAATTSDSLCLIFVVADGDEDPRMFRGDERGELAVGSEHGDADAVQIG